MQFYKAQGWLELLVWSKNDNFQDPRDRSHRCSSALICFNLPQHAQMRFFGNFWIKFEFSKRFLALKGYMI
jgi:hypothetical protein